MTLSASMLPCFGIMLFFLFQHIHQRKFNFRDLFGKSSPLLVGFLNPAGVVGHSCKREALRRQNVFCFVL